MPSSQPLYRTLHPINISNVVDVVDGKYWKASESVAFAPFCFSGGVFFLSNLASSARQPERCTPHHANDLSAFVSIERDGHRTQYVDAYGQAWLIQKASSRPSFVLFRGSLIFSRVEGLIFVECIILSSRGTNITCSLTHSVSRYQWLSGGTQAPSFGFFSYLQHFHVFPTSMTYEPPYRPDVISLAVSYRTLEITLLSLYSISQWLSHSWLEKQRKSVPDPSLTWKRPPFSPD
jgi:hypothetical protein